MLRSGLTTGTCAAAAAKAATIVLCGGRPPQSVDLVLPEGKGVSIPILYCRKEQDCVEAAVRKDGGDDPDITNGAAVVASVTKVEGGEIVFIAGEGVGTVTLPGLSVAPGEPAVNPVPRQMIRQAIEDVTDSNVKVTLSIPGGDDLARKTFNRRLGIKGGLSILGTTGRVRPRSVSALRCSLACSLDVAKACLITAPVFVPGNIGRRAAMTHFRLLHQQIIEVSNEWGYMLDLAGGHKFNKLLLVGHPGKLSKLAAGEFDTHASRSRSAVPIVEEIARQVLSRVIEGSNTVEGIFAALDNDQQQEVATAVAGRVRESAAKRVGGETEVAAVLVNMKGAFLGSAGNLEPWQ